ncbi:MAG: DUF116 domain-containing protein [Proteobacteria bacterium]|nr:DUF116 domain-containing protein [Pseudomonadota bacterium]MBU2518733.1 DUF116 domain-containing protein [Pseudomonadota bacterium]
MSENGIWIWLAWLGLVLAGLGVVVLGPLLLGRLLCPRLTLALFRRFSWVLSGLLDRISPGLDLRLLVKAGNRYFRKAFAATPFSRRVLFLPFCLRPLDCPAEVDREKGLLCIGGCPGCQVGQVRAEALALGYAAVYVVPSSRILRGMGLLPSDQFIKNKIKAHAPGAALGVTCPWHLRNRLLAKYTLRNGNYASVAGKEPKNQTVAPLQGVLMDRQNCRHGSVNWENVRFRLTLELETSRGN